MEIIKTTIEGVLIFQPSVFTDSRGEFLETWSMQRYRDAGIKRDFVQDNVSYSGKDVLRGLHYQHPHGQGKLVHAIDGTIIDVAVDIRVDSPTFGRHVAVELSSENHKQFFIPEGFAHGFIVLSDSAIFSYKCTDYYNGPSEASIAWNDPDIAIDWPCGSPVLSEKDAAAPKLKDIPIELLPKMGDYS